MAASKEPKSAPESSATATKRKVKVRQNVTVPFENGKFEPKLPGWSAQQKSYITQQLANFRYFKQRPHVYPAANFSDFVRQTAATLERKKRDFCWSMDWDPVFFADLVYHGFLTIASEIQDDLYVMLPKLHEERCVIDLDGQSAGCHLPIPVSKSTKKKARSYRVSVDQRFEEVFQGCIDQHGLNWLYPPMQAVLYSLFQNRGDPKFKGVTAHSIEIWNEDDELVAGELGTSVGSIYTSLTGFYLESSTGSIQLMTLGHLLQKCGFLLWDLGMFIEYKSSLGAGLLPRKEFLGLYGVLRAKEGAVLECGERVNCRDIVNEIVNRRKKEERKAMDEDGDEKQSADNAQRPKSRKEMKRIAKMERRRLAKQRAKEEKEKRLRESASGQPQNVHSDDTKDVPVHSGDVANEQAIETVYKRPKDDVESAKD